MTTILIVRHGETDWNRERRWQGHADRPLNELGREQARELAERLAAEPVAAVYSSDLARAAQTAEILATRIGLDVRFEPRLREVDVGEWSGLTWEEVATRYPNGARRRLDGGAGWERGETYEQMGARVLEGLREIAADHPDESVLAVTHGGPMREIWLACGLPATDRPAVANCDVHRVFVEDGTIRRID